MLPVRLFRINRLADRCENCRGKYNIVRLLNLIFYTLYKICNNACTVLYPKLIILVCLLLSAKKIILVKQLLELNCHLASVRQLLARKGLAEAVVKSLHSCDGITRVTALIGNGIADIVKIKTAKLWILFKKVVVKINECILNLDVCGVNEYVRTTLFALENGAVIVIHYPSRVINKNRGAGINANIEILHPGVYLYTVLLAASKKSG